MSRWRTYHLAGPPRTLRRRNMHLDNIALVPASLLPFKSEYQAIANRLPKGRVLIIVPRTDRPQRRTLATVAGLLRAKGHPVTTLPAERFGG